MEWLVTALFSMLGFDYKNKRRKDRELLERFLNVLPSDSDSILFLKDHDMGFSARYAYFSPLNRVREDWMAPDKEFQVAKLERLKVAFIEKLDEFLREYAKRSGGEGGGFISIGLRDDEDRQEMLEYRHLLNRLSTEAYERYERFVNTAWREI